MNRYGEDAPELAILSSPPEVVYHHHDGAVATAAPMHQQYHEGTPAPAAPVHMQYPQSAASETSTTVFSPVSKPSPSNGVIYGHEQKEVAPQSKSRWPLNWNKTLCGFPASTVVFSIIIAIMAVIIFGLAAGLGVSVKNYTDANTKLDAALFSRSNANLTNGCSGGKKAATGSRYSTHFYDSSEYVLYCDKDNPNGPIFSLFTGNFNNCMESCTMWNKYRNEKNYSTPTCETVTYIPYWSSIQMALGNSAPGDCYLKPGPVNLNNFTDTGGDMEVHAAVRHT